MTRPAIPLHRYDRHVVVGKGFLAIAAVQHRRHSGYAPSPSVSAIRRVSAIAARFIRICIITVCAVYAASLWVMP